MSNLNPNGVTKRGVREALVQVFVQGPDPEIGRWLPWWMRLAIVAGLALIGWLCDGLPAGKQLTWGLQYVALIGVSLVASLWAIFLIVNVVLGGGWLYLSWKPPSQEEQLPADGESPPTTPLSVATSLNRHWGHIEVFATWTAFVLAAYPALFVQLAGVGALLLLGAPLINGFTRFAAPPDRRPSKDAGDLQLERRLWIYLATLAGLVFLSLCAPYQFKKVLSLYLMLGGGLGLRYWRFRRRKSQEEGRSDVRELRRAMVKQRSSRGSTLRDIAFGPGLILLGVAVIAVWSYIERSRIGEIIQGRLNGPAAAADRCVPEPGGPTAPSFGLFIVADTQLHELGGTRFPGQLEIADTLVSVAIRPVELDILAGAMVRNLGDTFDALVRAKQVKQRLWTHLGDFADLSCKGEMDRTLKLLDGFGAGLAGVAPGNHDRAFTGNFYWSPFWDTACRSSRLEKEDSDNKILAALGKHMVPGGKMEPIQRWSWRTGFAETPSALVSVSRLGVLKHEGTEHGVLGIFVDTSDRHASDFGLAGVYGTFSDRQADTIRRLVADVKAQDADPLFILFAHHPFGEMTPRSHARLQKLLCELDGDASCGEDRSESAQPARRRVLAIISAHTHHAQRVRHCVGSRLVREIIVGSTLDPPQEAAWLEAGTDIHGRAALRVQTLPAVKRADRTCDDFAALPAAPTAARCRSVVAALAADPSCRELFTRPGDAGTAGPPCAELERPLSFEAKLQALQTYGGPSRPSKIKQLQERRAKNLLSCVCRKGDCNVPEHPFDDEAYEVAVMTHAQSPEGREELTCLGWAASSVQAHKAAGMQMADALRCAFDDPTIAAALESVAVLEDVPCE